MYWVSQVFLLILKMVVFCRMHPVVYSAQSLQSPETSTARVSPMCAGYALLLWSGSNCCGHIGGQHLPLAWMAVTTVGMRGGTHSPLPGKGVAVEGHWCSLGLSHGGVGAALELQGRWRVSELAPASIRSARLKEGKKYKGACQYFYSHRQLLHVSSHLAFPLKLKSPSHI